MVAHPYKAGFSLIIKKLPLGRISKLNFLFTVVWHYKTGFPITRYRTLRVKERLTETTKKPPTNRWGFFAFFTSPYTCLPFIILFQYR